MHTVLRAQQGHSHVRPGLRKGHGDPQVQERALRPQEPAQPLRRGERVQEERDQRVPTGDQRLPHRGQELAQRDHVQGPADLCAQREAPRADFGADGQWARQPVWSLAFQVCQGQPQRSVLDK